MRRTRWLLCDRGHDGFHCLPFRLTTTFLLGVAFRPFPFQPGHNGLYVAPRVAYSVPQLGVPELFKCLHDE